MTKIVSIDCNKITNEESLHSVFSEAFGFPDYYGNNMDAWIDCMSSLDEESGMSEFKLEKDEALILKLENASKFIKEHNNLYQIIFECSSFVNYRRVEQGDKAILAIMISENL